jgi:hypothetical protein
MAGRIFLPALFFLQPLFYLKVIATLEFCFLQ